MKKAALLLVAIVYRGLFIMLPRRLVQTILFMILAFCISPVTDARADSVIRNGFFSNGLSNWNINPALPSSWDPLVTHPVSGNISVNIHPQDWDFSGTVIYQNLNVGAIADKSFHLSLKATNNSAPEGRTIAVYLTYADTSNDIKRVKVLNPVNSSITTFTLVSADYTFPANARKLVKIEIAKEEFGDFTIDNVVLSADGTTVGAVPVIYSLTPGSGRYGKIVAINGLNFGDSAGTVTMHGSADGLTVKSWTNETIRVAVDDPAQSGWLCVIADFTESNVNKTFDVTSPNFTAEISDASATVIKGETAEFTVKADFNKGFTSSNIFFSVLGNSALSAASSFAPLPLKASGGVLLRINTSALAPGLYQAFVRAKDKSLKQRLVPFTLEVVAVSDIRFFEYDASNQKTYITSKNLTAQDAFYIGYEVVGPLDRVLSSESLTFSSSNPGIIGAYRGMFGYSFYALDSGSADLIAATPDGFTKHLPVTISLAPPRITSLSLVPSVVANTYSGLLNFYAESTDPLSWIGYEYSGMPNFGTNDFFTNLVYSNGNTTAVSAFHIATDPLSEMGTVLFYARTGSSVRITPLTIVNGPSTSEVKGAAEILDDTFAEGFTLAFYNTNNTLAFSRELFLMHGNNNFDIGGIPPGTYKLMMSSPGEQTPIGAQWYPNAASFSKAAEVSFAAGQTVEDIYFFLKAPVTAQPDISVSPVLLNFGNIAVGNTSAAQTLRITNRGKKVLTISGFGIAGTHRAMFGLTNNCSSFGPGQSCIATVTFTPSAAGKKRAFFHILSNDPDTPVLDFLLSGTGQ